MPNIFIHEKVAYNLAKENKYLDTPNFYLGVLAPDAVNLNGFAPKEESNEEALDVINRFNISFLS